MINAKAAPATIQSVDILDADDRSRTITTYGPEQILDSLRTTFPRPAPDATIRPGETRFLYLELAFDTQQDMPRPVSHRFNLLAPSNPGATEPSPMSYPIAPVSLISDSPRTLAPPLSGPGWVDFNGGVNNLIVHRGSIQTVNGGFHLAQRYAIDYMRLTDAGQIVDGDPADVTSNVAYGADVPAVADSTVAQVLDELPDQPPGTLPDPASISGNTCAPHQHFHVTDGARTGSRTSSTRSRPPVSSTAPSSTPPPTSSVTGAPAGPPRSSRPTGTR